MNIFANIVYLYFLKLLKKWLAENVAPNFDSWYENQLVKKLTLIINAEAQK